MARPTGKTREKRCGVSEEFNNKYSISGKVKKCQKGEQKEIPNMNYVGHNNLKTEKQQ